MALRVLFARKSANNPFSLAYRHDPHELPKTGVDHFRDWLKSAVLVTPGAGEIDAGYLFHHYREYCRIHGVLFFEQSTFRRCLTNAVKERGGRVWTTEDGAELVSGWWK